jgi:hypothetical protein
MIGASLQLEGCGMAGVSRDYAVVNICLEGTERDKKVLLQGEFHLMDMKNKTKSIVGMDILGPAKATIEIGGRNTRDLLTINQTICFLRSRPGRG